MAGLAWLGVLAVPPARRAIARRWSALLFLSGLGLLAWAALALTHRPPAAISSGVVVWLGALDGGMVLRQASGQGTATAFVVVATLVLGALLVLPRVGARVRR